ncbi:MAG: hypothetical protein HRU25_11615 [Psychrobium sp.]|nr:hypothetical protein [Psychrobium sp.]
MAEQVIFETLSQSGKLICDNFRQGYEGEANELLISFIGQLEHYLAQNDNINNEYVEGLLNLIFQGQQRRDAIFIADIIEYELLVKLAPNFE